jgi:PRTRC genetic system protein E
MFDFTKIANLIPPQGKVTFTITTGERGKLVVLFHPMYPELKGLSGKEKELYEQARVPLVFKATPEELNEGFMSLIEQNYEEEGRLHRAFSAKREAVSKAIAGADKGKIQKEESSEEEKTSESEAVHPTSPQSEAAQEVESSIEKKEAGAKKEPSAFDLFG